MSNWIEKMATIVLNSLMRSSIRYNKAMNTQAKELSHQNATGQISNKDSKSVSAYSTANKLQEEVNKLSHDLSKAQRMKSSLEATNNAVSQIRTIVERMHSLESTVDENSSLQEQENVKEQVDELRAQIGKIAGGATFDGRNLLTGWGSEAIKIGNADFTLNSLDIDDVARGKATTLGGVDNIWNIQNSTPDTSSYENLIGAFVADVDKGTISDYTGNIGDGTLFNGASVQDSNGLASGASLELSNSGGVTASAGGQYAIIPEFTLGEEFTISSWQRMDEVNGISYIYDFTESSGSQNHSMASLDFGGNMANLVYSSDASTFGEIDMYYHADPSSSVPTYPTAGGDAFDTPIGEWNYWTTTGKNISATQSQFDVYFNGELIGSHVNNFQISEVTRTANFLGTVFHGTENNFDGGISDLAIFNKALDATEVDDLYNDLGLTGMEEKFGRDLSTDEFLKVLDKVEGHFASQMVAIEAMETQMSHKISLSQSHAADLLSINKEEVATQLNLLQTRQQLSLISMSIASQSQSSILSLF